MDFDNREGTFIMIINSNGESISHHLWFLEHTHVVESLLFVGSSFGIRDISLDLPHRNRNGG
jgi:hypothetical protein